MKHSSFFFLFLFLIGKHTKRNILEKGTLRLIQKHTGVYKRRQKAQTKEEGIQKITGSQLAPSQSKKLSKGRGPSLTTDLVHNQRLHTKFQPMNRKLLIIKSNPISFLPNRLKKTQRGCLPHLSTLLAQVKATPSKKGISNRKRNDLSNAKKSKQ